MAKSPAHRFGQIIGEILESAIEPYLLAFAEDQNLYLDKRGPRAARGTNTRVVWVDAYGNAHNLDFVLERGGSQEKVGSPVAFIELAWRRYTKHSRNKAQEIQGAISPLVAAHSHIAPFAGVILAGVWTEGAMSQLESLNFKLLHFHYQTIVNAFSAVGIDASFDEATPDSAFTSKVQAWEKLSQRKRKLVQETLLVQNTHALGTFMEALSRSIAREIALITILPLFGNAITWQAVDDAITYVQAFDESAPDNSGFVRFEIEIRFNNNDNIRANFADKYSALEFLREYHLKLPHPQS